MVWMNFALVGSAVISWLAVAIALFCMFKVRRQSDLTEKLYKRLNHDLQLANSGSVGMGRRLIAMEQKLHSTSDELRSTSDQLRSTSDKVRSTEQRQLQMENQGDGFQAYTLAAELLDTGMAADDVAKRCGLSRAEASLMALMHSRVQSVDTQGDRKGAVAA